MIHYNAIGELDDQIAAHRETLTWDKRTATVTALNEEIANLQAQRQVLQLEQDEYSDGYQAGVEFHLDGVPMKDEWCGRSGQFDNGFDAAGQDS